MIIIVGAGQAGGQTACSLREKGYRGDLLIIGDELHLPYERPPLSKDFLKGTLSAGELILRPSSWFDDNDVEVRLGIKVENIDVENQIVRTDRSDTLAYQSLVLATGSRARPIDVEGAKLSGIKYLRTIDDVESLKQTIPSMKKVGIVGAGYIGLETGAALNSIGIDVEIFEFTERVLSRVSGQEISNYLTNEHKHNGISIHTECEVVGFEEVDGHVSKVRTGSHGSFDVDQVLVGIGGLPNDELACAAGVDCENGIKVDDQGRTSIENIFAAGDCTNRLLSVSGSRGRLESVHNAIEQAEQVASAIMGLQAAPTTVPTFWSQQGEVLLQSVGLVDGHDSFVIRGNPEVGQFSVWYFRQDECIAVEGVNASRDMSIAKRLLSKANRLLPSDIADPGKNLRDLMVRG